MRSPRDIGANRSSARIPVVTISPAGSGVAVSAARNALPIVRGAAEGVGSLGIGTRGEQRRHEMVVLALDRRVQRRRTVESGHVGIGARLEQELDDVGVPGDGRDPQR